MLLYHPALDPYHSAFRILRILYKDPTRSYAADTLRILDFLLLFPEKISQMRLPRKSVYIRSHLPAESNEYFFHGDHKRVFGQMRPLQEKAMEVLYASGLITSTGSQELVLVPEALPDTLIGALEKSNSEDPVAIDFIADTLGHISLMGAGGLKDRTGLMDYRYDPA